MSIRSGASVAQLRAFNCVPRGAETGRAPSMMSSFDAEDDLSVGQGGSERSLSGVRCVARRPCSGSVEVPDGSLGGVAHGAVLDEDHGAFNLW